MLVNLASDRSRPTPPMPSPSSAGDSRPPTASCATRSPRSAGGWPASGLEPRRPGRRSSAPTTGTSWSSYLAVLGAGCWSPCRSTRSARRPSSSASWRPSAPGRSIVGPAAPRPFAEHRPGRAARPRARRRSSGGDAGDERGRARRPARRRPAADRRPRRRRPGRADVHQRHRRRAARRRCSRHGNLLANIDQIQAPPRPPAGQPTTWRSACCRCSTSSGSTSCSA